MLVADNWPDFPYRAPCAHANKPLTPPLRPNDNIYIVFLDNLKIVYLSAFHRFVWVTWAMRTTVEVNSASQQIRNAGAH